MLNKRSDRPHIDIELMDLTGNKKGLDKIGTRILEKVLQPTNFLIRLQLVNCSPYRHSYNVW
ncbi:MAG: hypothetical protein WBF33_38550 [Candidatus Nitrosopolaris sp.]